MARLREDNLRTNLIINGNQAKKELGELEVATRDLRVENKDLRIEKKKLETANKKESEEYKKVTAAIKKNNAGITENEAKMKGLRKQIGLTGLTTRQLGQEQKRLRSIMSNLTPGTAAWKKYRAELKKVDTQLGKVSIGSRRSQGAMSKLAGGFNKFSLLAGTVVASLTGVIFSMKELVMGNAGLTDSFADVRKTTGLTDTEVKKLYKTLKTFDTRTANRELLGLARIAGKLGVKGKAEIEGFVKSADKLNVALGEDLGGNVEDTIKHIGKLVDIFKVKQKFGLEEGLLKVGSAINALGASSTASEQYIVEFSKRVGGIAPNAKMSAADVFGLAATLDQLGQTSEVSSTVFGKLMVAIGKDVSKFAEIAGMELEDFSKLLNDDVNAALIKVLEGAQGNKEGLEGMAESLQKLGIDGQRSVGVIGVLTKNIDLLRKQQKLSNIEFDKGTSLTEEYNIKNETLAAKLEKIGKRIRSAFISSKLVKFLENTVDNVDQLTLSLKKNSTIFKNIGKVLLSVTSFFVAYKIAVALVNATTKSYNIITKVATFVTKAFNKAIKANPIGLFVGALIAAGTAFLLFREKVTLAIKIQKDFNDINRKVKSSLDKETASLDILFKQLKLTNPESDERRMIVDKINKQYPDLISNINLEKAGMEDLTTAYSEYIKQMELKIRGTVLEDKVKDIISSIDELQAKAAESKGARLIDIQHQISSLELQKTYIYDELTFLKNKQSYGEKIAELIRQENQLQAELNMLKATESFYVGDFTDEEKKLDKMKQSVKITDLENEKLALTLKIKEAIAAVTIPLKEDDLLDDDDDDGGGDGLDEKVIKTREKLNKSLAQLLIDYESSRMESHEREIQQIKNKYDKEIEAAKGHKDLILKFNELKDKEIASAEAENKKELEDEKLKKEEEFEQHRLAKLKELKLLSNEKLKELELENLKSDFDNKLLLVDEYDRAVAEIEDAYRKLQKEKDKKAADVKRQLREKELANALAIANAITNAVNAAMDLELEKAGENEEKKKQIMKKYADIRFAAASAQIIANTAIAIMRALAELGPIAGGIVAGFIGVTGLLQLGIANAERQKVKQLAKGKYDVIGADDGRTYKAKSVGKVKTGYYREPTVGLFSEKEPEIVIDGPTTNRIMSFDPGIMDAINYWRAPQYAEGKNTEIINNNSTQEILTDPVLTNAIIKLNETIEKGIIAKVDYLQLQDKETEYAGLIADVS